MKTKTVEDALKCADACRQYIGTSKGPMFGDALVILADEVLRLRKPSLPPSESKREEKPKVKEIKPNGRIVYDYDNIMSAGAKDPQFNYETGECTHGLIGNYLSCNGSPKGCCRAWGPQFRHCCYHLKKEWAESAGAKDEAKDECRARVSGPCEKMSVDPRLCRYCFDPMDEKLAESGEKKEGA